MRRGTLASLTCAIVALGGSLPATTLAEDAPFVPWNQLLPALPGDFRPSVFEDCADGDPGCIDHTLNEMWRRFHRVVGECNHNAVFSLTYIRVTEDYKRAAERGLPDEPRFLAHEDRVFARLYFNAYDNWRAGRADLTPPAWRLAFDAADRREVAGVGNLLMGINAHVNRDMPFMLAGLGLTRPDGVSRKSDHDRFNELLNQRFDSILKEIAQRFDPSVDDLNVPGVVDNLALIQILQGWREQVWRHAEMLTYAPSDAARRIVSDYIEDYAVSIGREVKRFFQNSDPERRASTCAATGGQRPHNFAPPHLAEDPAGDPPRQTIGAAEPLVPDAGLRVSRTGRFNLVLACPDAPGPCSGSVVLAPTRGGRRLATHKFSVPAGRSRGLRLRLAAPGRRALARSRSGRLSAEVRVRTPDVQSQRPHVTRSRASLRRR